MNSRFSQQHHDGFPLSHGCALAVRGPSQNLNGGPSGGVRVFDRTSPPCRFASSRSSSIVFTRRHTPLNTADFNATARLYHHGRLFVSEAANGSMMLSISV